MTTCICQNGARVTCPEHGAGVERLLAETEERHRAAGYTPGPLTAKDKLRELLATRPEAPTAEEMERWWRTGGQLVTELLDFLRDHTAPAVQALEIDRMNRGDEIRQLRSDLDAARAALRREQDARAQLRVELDRAKTELAKLHHAAPVMLSVMALLADECDLKGLREVALWFCDVDPDHLNTWLDAEHARVVLAATKEPCCPSASLPGGRHDIACRGGGKVH